MLLYKSNDCPFCGKGHTNQCFAIYDDGYHCFSCGKTERKSEGYYSFSKFRQKSKNSELSFHLPECSFAPKDFPLHILAWLYKYYVYNDLIIQHNIAYAPYQEFTTSSGIKYTGESIIYPIIVDDEVRGFQQRFFPDKQVYSLNINKHVFLVQDTPQNTVVLVEDPLSAIRVGQVLPSICLFGTHISNKIISFCEENFNNIIIWLDGDEPGIQASNTVHKRLNDYLKINNRKYPYSMKFSARIDRIVTQLDPKAYAYTEIKEILRGYYHES